MSENGEAVHASGASGCGSDMFEDEERMGGLLKSLISAKGLQSQWQVVGKRLQAAEQTLKQMQHRIDQFPTEFVTRADYHELVETKHTEQLAEQDKVCSRVDEVASRLEKIIIEEQSPQVQNCLDLLQARKEEQAQIHATIAEIKEKEDERYNEILEKLQAIIDEASKHVAQNGKEHAQVQEQLEGMAVEISEVEKRMQEFTNDAIQKMTSELLSFDADDVSGPSEQQAQMLEFVRKALIDAVYVELAKGSERTADLARDVGRHRDELSRQIRAAEKTVGNMNTRMKQMIQEIREDLDTRTKRSEATATEAALATTITNVSSVLRALQTKVVLKLNEFVDHFGKLHVTIDDHEHCLRHHAEEIENRSTKYDLLICQNQIEKCALKDEILRETTELRKVVSWQSSKIGSFGLANQGLRKKKKNRASLQVNGSFLSVGRSASRDTMTTIGSDEDVSPSSPEKGLTPVGENREGEAHGSFCLDESKPGSAHSEDDADDEDDSIIDESDPTPDAVLVRQQLEAVSMGLVGLGHLLLKEPKLGTSRNAKLIQERELLEELQNLRHWITNRMAPAGWNPDKITTVALRCTHPREDEVQHPLPQVSLKGILFSASDEPPMRHKRFPSADQLDGAKTAPLATINGDRLTKFPLSARGPHTGQSLPPLLVV